MSWIPVSAFQDPDGEVDAEWMCLWADFGTCLYPEDDIDGLCVEAKQVRNPQIDISSD
jgi:hypothetical protein